MQGTRGQSDPGRNGEQQPYPGVINYLSTSRGAYSQSSSGWIIINNCLTLLHDRHGRLCELILYSLCSI